MNHFARTASVAGAAALIAMLTACATASAPPVTGPAGSTDTVSATDAPRVAWLDRMSVAISTATDGCAPRITDRSVDDQRIDVTLTAPDDCDAAASGRAGTYLTIPAGIDTSEPVTIGVIENGGEASLVELAPYRDGTLIPADLLPEQVPAAAWIDEGQLAVLTWGSSSCAPRSGAVVGDVLTLDEPADAVCTMDCAPRITLVAAPDVAADAVLTLDGYTDESGAPVTLALHP
ncbi:hypothetical protein [Microbacterium sp.]|uniref:hypothetical protein n=1 Tax=Microbacterium sp. TaxID=51671 RepID=UPI0039E41741